MREPRNFVETSAAGRPPATQFVAISRFTVANDMTERVKAAFAERPHLVDDAPGFVRMEVMSPVDEPDEIWLVTYWRDRDSFATWHRSHEFKQSHRGIPKGLKLVPKSAELRFFEIFST